MQETKRSKILVDVRLGRARKASPHRSLREPEEQLVTFLGIELSLYRPDSLSLIFGLGFVLAAALGGVYSLHRRDRLQDAAGLVYAGSALGAIFAGDPPETSMFLAGVPRNARPHLRRDPVGMFDKLAIEIDHVEGTVGAGGEIHGMKPWIRTG